MMVLQSWVLVPSIQQIGGAKHKNLERPFGGNKEAKCLAQAWGDK